MSAIEAVATPLAEWLRLIRPRSPQDFWTMLGVLLMALQLAMSLAQDQSVSEQEIARLIDEAIQRVAPEHALRPPPVEPNAP